MSPASLQEPLVSRQEAGVPSAPRAAPVSLASLQELLVSRSEPGVPSAAGEPLVPPWRVSLALSAARELVSDQALAQLLRVAWLPAFADLPCPCS